MKKDAPKCEDCGLDMVERGSVIIEHYSCDCCGRTITLWQCPECKSAEIS